MNDPNDGETQTHPSFGMIRVGRIRGADSVPMFGSDLPNNPLRLRIEIVHAKQIDSQGDRYYMRNGLGSAIIAVDLTPSQYAELLSNPDVGDGVPCTISRLGGQTVPEPPRRETRAETIQRKFKLDTAAFRKKVVEGEKTIAAILDSAKSISQTNRASVLRAYQETTRFVHDMAPHLVEMFQEAVSKTVTEAKLEVDAFMTDRLRQVGLQSLQAGEPSTIDQLPGKIDP